MRRLKEHPILGPINETKKVNILVDGKCYTAYEGQTVASALIANGLRVFRKTSRFNAPRGIFCGIGQCTDCAMVVDGKPNVKTCVTRVRDGMIIETQYGNGKLVSNERD